LRPHSGGELDSSLSEIQKFKGNSRKTWELIKTLLPNKKAKQLPKKLEVDGNCVHDPELIAHHFGKHFSNIATKIVENISPTEKNKFKDFLKNRIHDSIYLQPTDPIEVFEVIQILKSNKSSGADDISPYFVRLAANIIANPISVLINHAFELGIFPDALKTAKIVQCSSQAVNKTLQTTVLFRFFLAFQKHLKKLFIK